jgi:hypothetical protein
MKRSLVVLAVLVAVPVVALAQKPVTRTEAVEVTAKIEAIDHTDRAITLKDEAGNLEIVYASPEVKRFDELKVGQTVTFRYYESIAFQIRKPGQPSGLPAVGEPKVVRGEGAKPSATISQQKTATVTIKAIDAKVPSVTVLTEDGRTASFKVEDAKNLKDLKAGDVVEITYTEAVLVSVK